MEKKVDYRQESRAPIQPLCLYGVAQQIPWKARDQISAGKLQRHPQKRGQKQAQPRRVSRHPDLNQSKNRPERSEHYHKQPHGRKRRNRHQMSIVFHHPDKPIQAARQEDKPGDESPKKSPPQMLFADQGEEERNASNPDQQRNVRVGKGKRQKYSAQDACAQAK